MREAGARTGADLYPGSERVDEEDSVGRDDGSGDRPVDPAEAGMDSTRAQLRASDADRQRVADRLRKALDEGRLTLLEYDERLAAAYGSLTYGELAKVTRDLPSEDAPALLPEGTPPPQPAVTERRDAARASLIQQAKSWLGGAVVTNGIWAATSGFNWHQYWPGVVLGIWAAVIVGGAISGRQAKPGQPDADRPDGVERQDQRQDQRQDRRQQRRERRAERPDR